MNLPNNHTGFTLIELLITVAIIGILSAIATANYIEAIERSEKSACQQHLRTLYTSLNAYKLDYNHFPPADGIAGDTPKPDQTVYGCGPAANGYWSGMPLLLSQLNYCPESTLYCPALKRRYNHKIAAWPNCSGTELGGQEVMQWKFLRFAYNSSATDVGNFSNGMNTLEENIDLDVWLIRCLHLDVQQFDPDRAVSFPFHFEKGKGEFELTLHGKIQSRIIQ